MGESMECDAVREPRPPHSSAAISRAMPEGAGTGEAAFALHAMLAGKPAEDITTDMVKPTVQMASQAVAADAGIEDTDSEERAPAEIACGNWVASDGEDAVQMVGQPADHDESLRDLPKIDGDGFGEVAAIAGAISQLPGNDSISWSSSVIEGEATGEYSQADTTSIDLPADAINSAGADLMPVGDDDENLSMPAQLAVRGDLIASDSETLADPVPPNTTVRIGGDRARGEAVGRDIGMAPAISLPRHVLLQTPVVPAVGQESDSWPTVTPQEAPRAVPASLLPAATPWRVMAPLVSGEVVDARATTASEAVIDIAPRLPRLVSESAAVSALIGRSVPIVAMPWSAPQAGIGGGGLLNGLGLTDLAMVATDDAAAAPGAMAAGWQPMPFSTGHFVHLPNGHAAPAVQEAVTRQVAEAVVQMRDNSVEIALSPEELGTVRLSLSRSEGGGALTVWVERPEVLEALRRNADLLQADLKDAGLGGMQLDFRNSADRDPEGQGRGDHDDEPGNAIGAVGRHPLKTSSAEGATNPLIRPLGADRWRLDIRV